MTSSWQLALLDTAGALQRKKRSLASAPSQLGHTLAACPWASHGFSSDYDFLFRKMEILSPSLKITRGLSGHQKEKKASQPARHSLWKWLPCFSLQHRSLDPSLWSRGEWGAPQVWWLGNFEPVWPLKSHRGLLAALRGFRGVLSNLITLPK